jgi:SAM-dependent methyltransferase
MIFFTICSRNFTAYAGALWSSLREIYPDLKFYMVLCDDDADFDAKALQYPVVSIDDLGISFIERMKRNYNITELNTSLKPFAFEYIFQRHPGEVVVYLDPDIFVVSPLQELEDSFAQGADCVLTPHICEPAEYAEMNDLRFLNYGIYNFGFCALRDTATTRRLVAWWGRRLQEYCIIDSARGLFVDQKWGDYFPAFVENTKILHHPGYNVAYWNLAHRRLAKLGGEWLVNGLPLRFVHFSGNRIEDENVFTRHARQFNVKNTPQLIDLLARYRASIFRNGHQYYSPIPYAFSWSGAAGFNEHTPEELRRKASGTGRVIPPLPLKSFRSIEQYRSDSEFNAEVLAARRQRELDCIVEDAEEFEIDGHCGMCGQQTRFVTTFLYSHVNASGRIIPNWREHLTCTNCRFCNRVRAVVNVMDQCAMLDSDAKIYLTENITPFFDFMKKRWPDTVGSEYLSLCAEPGSIIDGVRHEDVQNLSFASDSFDLIVSLDVLEHVPFPDRAFAELHRTLRPNGTLVFTVPFTDGRDTDTIRAVMHDNGEIEHLLPEEYHGNPVDPENGALCFRHFSWDTVKRLKSVGFEDAAVLSYWSETLGHMGAAQLVIVAQKGGAVRTHS